MCIRMAHHGTLVVFVMSPQFGPESWQNTPHNPLTWQDGRLVKIVTICFSSSFPVLREAPAYERLPRQFIISLSQVIVNTGLPLHFTLKVQLQALVPLILQITLPFTTAKPTYESSVTKPSDTVSS